MTETAYTVVRILQKISNLRLPKDEMVQLVGDEEQKLTLVISPAQGCRVRL